MVTDVTGNCVLREDHLPFEQMITSTSANRGTCYNGTAIRQQFTSKERDAETGLDYLGARYMSSAQGRFTSPDNGSDQQPRDPQSWNLYSYARNNPLALSDPSGNYVCGSSLTADQCDTFQATLNRAQDAANQVRAKYGSDSDQYRDAQRAIDSYGERDKANGVTINLGSTPNGSQATTSADNGATKTELNPTGQNIQVTINGSLFTGATNNVVDAVAHEGSHVADAQDWAKAGFSDAASPTNGQTEFRAYGVSASIREGIGGVGTLTASRNGEAHVFWMLRLPQPVNDVLRSNMVKSLYPNWPQQAFKANTQGGN